MLKFDRNEKGQGLVEYALILALIAIVVIGALTALGGTVNGKFGEVNSTLGGGEGGGGSETVDTAPPARPTCATHGHTSGYFVTGFRESTNDWMYGYYTGLETATGVQTAWDSSYAQVQLAYCS